MNNDFPHRSWQVLLLGGPSGVGKTSVSYRLPIRASSFSESSIQSQVRTLFLYEESEEQFRHNFFQREPEHGLQEKRAQVSWLYGQWLKQEAERVGALTLPARPWNDLFERILTALK